MASRVLAFLLLAFSASAQVGPSLKISVTDPDTRPVTNARVTVSATLSTTPVEIFTNALGVAEVRPSVEGRWLIVVRAEGFADSSRYFDWRNQESSLDIPLAIVGLREQVTVTSGSRLAELQQDTPMKVEAVSREDMQSTGYERVTDVLAEIPGIVTRSGSSATVGTEQIWGIPGRQVAVLQDGLPMIGARGIKSGNLNLNRQSTGRLERIEVVKGAASALFGSDAIGGVVNMISREPTQKVQGNLNFSGGSLGIFDGRGDIGTRYKNLTVFLDLERHQQDSYRLIPNSPTTVGPDLARNDLLFRTRYAFSPRFSLGFTANAYHNNETARSAGETGLVNSKYNESVQNYALVGDFILTSTTTLQLRAYSARYDENGSLGSVANPSAPPALSNLNERYKRLDGTISQQLGARQFLQGGYEWVQDNYKGANRLVGDNAGRQVTSNDFWVQDKITISRRATLDLGGRITNNSLFGTYAVPKAGMVVRITDRWTARGSFGMGFRAPDLGQLFFRFANPASFYQVIGNPNLQPETSRSFSVGTDYRVRRFRGGVTFFRNDVRNLIDTINIGTPTNPAQLAALLAQYGIPASFTPLLGRQTFIYQNFGRIYTRGFELSAEQAITAKIRVAGAYTYLDARDTGTNLALPQRHRHQGYVKGEYVNAAWGLSTNIRGSFYSSWWLNPAAGTSAYGYGIWDFYISKNMRHGTQAYFSIDNLGNSRDKKLGNTPPTFDRADYGRMFRVGVRWQFGKE